MRNLLTIVMLTLCVSLSAQKPVLSPLPQQITWGEEITSDVSAIPVTKGVRGDEAVAAYESLIPTSADGYYLRLAADGIVIAGNDERGLFYGEKTLAQLLGADRTNTGHATTVYAAEVKDYPMVADRGVVEGFYGNPWTHEARLRMFDFLADNKMNMYIYGPKDDPYHWGKWSELYPTAELSRLKELVEYAAQVKVKFVWAVHTGQSLTEAQYTQLNAKFEQLYKIGVRTFGMFFDDAYGNGATQAAILNRMTEEFIKTHEGCEPFICCPAVYCGTFYSMGDSKYLPDMTSQTRESDVKIMWTGANVMDMQLGNSVQNFINSYGVKPFIWHNWPVNDYSRTHLFMGKTDGLDSKLYQKVCGFTANPMEFPEASKVTVYSVADYLWNMAAYDADRSWEQAWQYLYPAHGAEFGLFCQNSVNPGSDRISRPGESSYFTAALAAGTPAGTLFNDIYTGALALLADESDAAVSEEMRPWLRAMEITGHRGVLLDTLQIALDNEDPETFVAAYQKIKDLAVEATTLESHTWYGGSGRICPTYGTLVLQPYISKTMVRLAQLYKQAGYEVPEGLFEVQVLEDGVYFIKYGDQYLTNTGDDPNKTGDRPTFTSTVDDIKPARQHWRIELDGTTMRYKITSVADGRYVNENGKFWADKTLNAYDPEWNTYEVYRRNGKCAIQCGGKAGTKFWSIKNDYIIMGTSTTTTASNFFLEIEPVDGAIEHPVIESGKQYYIAYGNELLKDVITVSYPYFLATLDKTANMFTFTEESGKDGRFKITTAKVGSTHSYINEKGVFGTNQYYADWNSYELIERDGLWAIRNAESAGTNYWTVETDENKRKRIVTGGSTPNYIFEIGSDWQAFKDRVTAVSPVIAAKNAKSTIYNLNGQPVTSPSRGLYIVDGKKVVAD